MQSIFMLQAILLCVVLFALPITDNEEERRMATKISVSVGRTFNMGNYESLRLDEGMEINLEEGEDYNEARMMLLDKLDKQVDKDGKALIKRIKARK